MCLARSKISLGVTDSEHTVFVFTPGAPVKGLRIGLCGSIRRSSRGPTELQDKVREVGSNMSQGRRVSLETPGQG